MLRHAIERLCRGTVLRRRLPQRCGRRLVFVSPDSALRYLKPGAWSGNSDLFDIACEQIGSGDNVWDVGANVGMFAFAAANRVGCDGSVLAIEPDPFLASLLQRTAQHSSNRDMNVSILCAAVAERSGVMRFVIAEHGRSQNSLESASRSEPAGVRYVQNVVTLTLEDLLASFPAPDFVKVDVEGAEELVLKGAQKILSVCRPKWYIEVGSHQCEAVTRIFKSHDYLLYGGCKVSADSAVDYCEFNTLAIPSECK